MSRNETRHCDHCGKALYQDGGRWVGYSVRFEGRRQVTSSPEEIDWEDTHFDLCADCGRKFRQMEW